MQCTWCREPVSYYQAPCGRRCTGCNPDRIYCTTCVTSGCSAAFCQDHETCWQRHVLAWPPHERPSHQPVDPFPALFANAVIHSERNEERLKQLHLGDKINRWFYVRKEDEQPELWVYDRFTRLCKPDRDSSRATENHYPSIVSFIGNTTAGKSTIVRAMLLLGALSRLQPQGEAPSTEVLDALQKARDGTSVMPVSRSGNPEHKTDPTTFGVNLYRDQGIFESSPSAEAEPREVEQYPLLLADCEGFGAGTATTNAEKLGTLVDGDPAGLVKSEITASCYRDGKDGIELFYARVLYAISDVIVYVTNSDTTIQRDLTRVLEWAAAAVDKTYNQPSRKTLIIVRNKESIESEVKTSRDLERLFLKSFRGKKLWEESTALRAFVEKHNRLCRTDERIYNSNDQLYRALFRVIRCCYIPDKGESDASPARAREAYEQFKVLRGEIEEATEEERKLKAASFALYNVPTLVHILIQLFSHFSSSETPLDFYKAARRDNPRPRNIKQHIANFLRIALEHKAGPVDDIDKMIANAFALMMVIYTRRTFSREELTPDTEMFRLYLKTLWEEGASMYVKEYERCSFQFQNDLYCTVRGRASNHQRHIYVSQVASDKAAKTTLEAPGEFTVSRLWSQRDHEAWLQDLEQKFCVLYNHIFAKPAETDTRIRETRQKTQKAHSRIWALLQSNKTCLACLQAVPDHVLPCGHSYCPRCIQELALPSRFYESAFDMSGCILCGKHSPSPHQIQLKPKCAGVRILTLDGGGIRGIVELALLQALQNAVGPSPDLQVRISELFDLVVGTSTGGIVGLGLVMSDRPLTNLIKFFTDVSFKTFKLQRGGSSFASNVLLFFGRSESKFSAEPLKQGLCDFFSTELSLFAPSRQNKIAQSTARIAVTTARDGGDTETLIANYNRPLGDWSRFEREDDANADMKVWEAGLATSAAPVYLPPFIKQPENVDYIDGGVFANCPAKVALEEKAALWPQDAASLDILLSLGTGKQDQAPPRLPRAVRYSFFNPIVKMFERQQSASKLWDDLIRPAPPELSERLHRLNPPIKGERGDYVQLYHFHEIEHLQRTIDLWAMAPKNAAEIRHISNILIANLFFFEPHGNRPCHEEGHLTGSVRCRLHFESEALRAMLSTGRVTSFAHTTVSRTMASAGSIQTLPDSQWRPLRNGHEAAGTTANMFIDDAGTSKFRRSFQVALNRTDRTDEDYHVLGVKIAGEAGYIPISGFPTTLMELEKRSRSQWLQ